jgi:hypothetical protein
VSEYLIARCGRCGAVWALDYQPDGCTCDEYRQHPDDIDSIEADDYRAALDLCPWGRYPSVTDEP